MKKRPFKFVRIIALLLVLCFTAGCNHQPLESSPSGDSSTAQSAETTQMESPGIINTGVEKAGIALSVDSSKTYQTIKGFGASGCWWAANWKKTWSEKTIDEALEYLYSPTTGIGLNTYRYNVGGGTRSPKLSAIRYTKCIEVEPGVYDLSVDVDNIAVLDKIMKYNVNYITLFMNSPPARMTVSGNTNGNPDGTCNLKEEYYNDYVEYVTGVTAAFVNAGYPITYVSPINEPQWEWKEGTQEGSHYSPQQVMQIDRLVINSLKEKNLSVKISMPETGTWVSTDYTRKILKEIAEDPDLLNAIDHFCGHSYGAKASDKRSLARYIERLGLDLPLHQTEWGEGASGDELGMSSALVLGQVLHEDLSLLSVDLWEFWRSVEGDTKWCGGLVYLRGMSGMVQTSKRMWVMGNYSRFVTGATRVELTMTDAPSDVYGTAYIREDVKKTTFVVTNASSSEKPISFAGMDGKIGAAHQTSEQYDLQYIGDIDPAYGYVLPAQSVTTFVFE